MKKRKTFDIAISVIAAILLWTYVLNVVNPPTTQTVRELPVHLEHLEALAANKLAIADDANYTVDVVVEGPRAALSGMDESTLIVTADISAVGFGSNYVNVDVQSSDPAITVLEIHSQKIQIYVDEFVEIEKPLHVAYGVLDGDFEIAVKNVDSENIVVSGAKSLVDQVTEVRVDVDSSILETDKIIREELNGYPLDASGNLVNGVRLSSEEIGVTLTRLAVREVPLSVKTVGKPGLNASVQSVNAPKTVRIKGTSAALAEVTSLTADPVSVDGIVSNVTVPLKYALPPGISLADSQEPLKASVVLADMASVSYEYDLSEIRFLHLAEGLNVRIVSEEDAEGNVLSAEIIRVDVSGPLNTVKSISRESVAPALDLSSIQAGEMLLSVGSVYTKGDLSFVMDPAFIDVEISAIEAPPEEEPAAPEE